MAYTTIDDPLQYFNTLTYTGNGSSTHAITGVGFQPDFLWIKSRSASTRHSLQNSVAGITNFLRSNGTNAEAPGAVKTADSDGFTVDDSGMVNANSETFVSWNWLAGGSASSNSDGSVTSSVSANTTAGFSIVSYTGSGSNVTVGHGLGAVPKMIICKSRGNTDGSTSAARSWGVYHAGIASDAETDVITLDTTNAASDDNAPWNDTAPTSSVWSMGNDDRTNLSNLTYIAYLFAEKKGYSKFGSWTGLDGVFIYTGFKPAFILGKNASNGSAYDWWIFDNKRDTFNDGTNNLLLRPNATDVEATFTFAKVDFLSNGFKIYGTDATVNGSGDTMIYMAFAESPFVNSNGVPTNAR
tara:strand:- start:39 stop:1103 length:1065 start_codon:yes stop_codon:yes gene_type:complete